MPASAERRSLHPAATTKRLALVASILTVAIGCDKAKPAAPAGGERDAAARSAPELASHPDVLFQVFGDRSSPRMLPIATITDGKLATLTLSGAAWRSFDKSYTHSGTVYPLYQDGDSVGTARVVQGMWEQPDSTVYSLPGCRTMTPLAVVEIGGDAQSASTVELFAATRALGTLRVTRTVQSDAVSARVRRLGYPIAGKRGIDRADLDSLGLRAQAVPTGTSVAPTLVGTYIDNSTPGDGIDRKHPAQASQLLFLADSNASAYKVSYSSGGTARADSLVSERYVDHLDLDRDGVDEIILEGWTFDETSFPIVLKFRNGEWREIFRGSSSWCADVKKH